MWPQKAIVKKDVKSKMAAKKWLQAYSVRVYVTALLEYIDLYNKFSRGAHFINCHSVVCHMLLLTHLVLPRILY